MPERAHTPLWPFIAAAVIAVAGVLAALVWPDPPTSLRVVNASHGSGSGLPDVPVGRAYVYETYRVCVAHGPVSVTGVLLRESRGLRIVDWGVEPADGDAVGNYGVGAGTSQRTRR